MELLQKESELKEIVQLVGPDALPEEDKLILDTTKSLREDYLQQNAYDDVDMFCSLKKQNLMLNIILDLHNISNEAIKKGVKVKDIENLSVKKKRVGKMKYVKEIEKEVNEIKKEFESQLKELQSKVVDISAEGAAEGGQ